MRALSAREQRLVALLLLVVAAALVQLVVIGPIVSGFTSRAERRAMLQLRYQANQRVIGAIPRLRREAERQRAATDRFTLRAADAGTADEALRERLQHAVEAAGGEFRGSESIAVTPGWAGARLTARLSAPQTMALIAMLENQTPYLIARALVVSADDALVTGHASPLDVQLEVSVPLRLARAR